MAVLRDNRNLSRGPGVWSMIIVRQEGTQSLKAMDIAVGAGVAVGFILLFFWDFTSPRGFLDGVGYPVLIALSSRFGTRAISASSILACLLVILGAMVGPSHGISLEGTVVNRSFALVQIAIIAGILLHRIKLAEYIAARNRELRKHQRALSDAVREGLQADKPAMERIGQVTELGAAALNADVCGIIRASASGGLATIKVIDVWDARTGQHFSLPDISLSTSPGYKEALEKDHYVVATDAFASPLHKARNELHRRLNIRGTLVATPMGYDRGLPMVVLAFGDVHHWTEDEIAFAKGLANVAAIQSSSTRADQMVMTLDLIKEGIYVSSPKGDIRYANRAAIGMAREFGDNGETSFPAPAEPLSESEDVHTIAHNGREFEISRVRVQGEVLSRINDVTERNSALALRKRLEERLQQASKMEAIGQLAGGVAHDFNNILGSILGFAGFLAQDLPAGSTAQSYAARILRAAMRGSQLVEQTLAFANTQAGNFAMIDLRELLEQCREALGELPAAGVRVAIQPPSASLIVAANAVQIGQVLTNLAKNACDALEGQGGQVSVSMASADRAEMERLQHDPLAPDERLIGEFDRSGEYCQLRVVDDGPGISPALLDRIFEPFFTTKGRHRGTGLGLAVVHGIVRAHNGVMHVRASEGNGAAFTIYFPLASGLESTVVAITSDAQDARGTERVLVVDDEVDVADAVTIGLERLGYQAVEVNHPDDALAAISEDPTAFDVLITDELMPGMRGVDLIRAAKRVKPDLVTVLCTGHSAETNQYTALQAGADLFFYKPVTAAQISIRLRKVLIRPK